MSDLVAAYLFFAGAGSGAAFLMAVLDFALCRNSLRGALGLRDARAVRRAQTLCVLAALALVGLGVLCLLLDLGRPEVAFKLFTRPHATLLTFGAWALLVLLVSATALVAFNLVSFGDVARRRFSRGARARGDAHSLRPQGSLRLRSGRRSRAADALRATRGAVVCVVLVSSACVMSYTGVLLRDIGTVPLWDTWLLPVLFVASALASGLAVCGLCATVSMDGHRVMVPLGRVAARADVAVVLAEAAVAAAYLCAASRGSVGAATIEPLVTGAQSGLFVGGFLLLGMAAPLVCDVAQAGVCRRVRPPAWVAPLTAVFVLVGAACLRLCLVQAGALPTDSLLL